MLKSIFALLLFVLLSFAGIAQTYYRLTDTAGVQAIGGIVTTITRHGTATHQANTCVCGPYRSSYFGVGSITFAFSHSVSKIRMQLCSINPDDTISVNLNNIPYYITSSNLSLPNNNCNAPSLVVIANNGSMTGNSNATSFVQFDVDPGYGINNVDILANNGSGVIYSFYFASNCNGNINLRHDSMCIGQSFQLHMNDTAFSSNAAYSWIGPNNFTSNQASPMIENITATSSGVYSVTVNDTGCTYIDSVTLWALPSPSAPIASSNTPVCVGSSLQLLSTDTTANIQYTWIGPNSFLSSLENPQITNTTYNDSGIYTAIVSLNGCKDSASVHVVVKSITDSPTIMINSDRGNITCIDSSAIFTANATNATNPIFQWRKNGNDITGATSATYTPPIIHDGDIFSCFITSNDACQSQNTALSNFIVMHTIINTMPSVNISAYPTIYSEGGTVTFTAYTNNSTGLHYQWQKNGIDIVGATTSSYSADTLHTGDVISVLVTSSVPCTLPDTASSNFISLDVNNIKNDNFSLSLYSNPNKGSFIVHGITSEISVIEIFNSLGQLVKKREVQPNDSKINENVELDNAPNGFYLLHFSNNHHQKNIPFIVNK